MEEFNLLKFVEAFYGPTGNLSWVIFHMNFRRLCILYLLGISSVQPLSPVQLFATPLTAAWQASMSITNSRSQLKLTSIELVMPSNVSSSVIPFSCLQSFPASGSFQISQFFSSGGQGIGVLASASVLPVNIQDWFPLGWTGWISLQSKRLSRVFSQHHSSKASILWHSAFFMVQLSHPHTLTRCTFVSKVIISAF